MPRARRAAPNNRDWWTVKLTRTRERDRAKDEAHLALGHAVLHVWEHETPVEAADTVERIWRQRTGRLRAGAPPPGGP